MMRIVSLLNLLWSLVEVNCQTAPYISFLGNDVPNHGYVDLSLVGGNENGADSVQCHTDLNTYCTNSHGSHRGDWFTPGETDRLPLPGNPDGDIFEKRGNQRVDLRRRNNANSPVGIYRCGIQTAAVHVGGGNSLRDTVYVGLYTSSEGMGTELLANFRAG